MSRLTKWIESLQKDVVIKESKSTNSQYFELGSVKIRVSDHFTEKEGNAIQIILPMNSKTIYLVKIQEGVNILSFTFAELKTFITNYMLIKQIVKHGEDYAINKAKLAEEQSKRDKEAFIAKQEAILKETLENKENSSNNLSKLLGFNVNDPILRTSERYYTKVVQDVKRQLNFKIGDLSDKKRKIIRTQIIGRNIPYVDVIATLKEAKEEGIFKKLPIMLEGWVLTKFNK